MLNKYNKDKDQYTDYLTNGLAGLRSATSASETADITSTKRKFTEAYSTGAKILADEPNYLRAQIDLGYAGYLAASAKNAQFNSTALDYARSAIQAIESGKTPNEWAPFKGKDDTLAYLNYAVGFLTLKPRPNRPSIPCSKRRSLRVTSRELRPPITSWQWLTSQVRTRP
jgi:hypothetical protein